MAWDLVIAGEDKIHGDLCFYLHGICIPPVGAIAPLLDRFDCSLHQQRVSRDYVLAMVPVRLMTAPRTTGPCTRVALASAG